MTPRLPTWHTRGMMSALTLTAACSGQSDPTTAERVIVKQINDGDNAVHIGVGPISADVVVLIDGRPIHNTSEFPSDTSLIYSIEITKHVNEGMPRNGMPRATVVVTTRVGQHR